MISGCGTSEDGFDDHPTRRAGVPARRPRAWRRAVMFLTCLAPIRGGRRPGNSVGGVMRVWRDEKRWMPRRREVEHAPTRSESRRTTRNVHGRGILAFVGVESAQTAPRSGGSVVGRAKAHELDDELAYELHESACPVRFWSEGSKQGCLWCVVDWFPRFDSLLGHPVLSRGRDGCMSRHRCRNRRARTMRERVDASWWSRVRLMLVDPPHVCSTVK